MNPRHFLYAVGVILLGLGIIGFIDPRSPGVPLTSTKSRIMWNHLPANLPG